MPDPSQPVACSLSIAAAADQAGEWTALGRNATATERVDGGVAMTLPVELAEVAADLAARESACCAFLAIAVTRIGDAIRVEITSENPDAAPVIEALTPTG